MGRYDPGITFFYERRNRGIIPLPPIARTIFLNRRIGIRWGGDDDVGRPERIYNAWWDNTFRVCTSDKSIRSKWKGSMEPFSARHFRWWNILCVREKYLFRNICKEIIRRVSLLIYIWIIKLNSSRPSMIYDPVLFMHCYIFPSIMIMYLFI